MSYHPFYFQNFLVQHFQGRKEGNWTTITGKGGLNAKMVDDTCNLKCLCRAIDAEGVCFFLSNGRKEAEPKVYSTCNLRQRYHFT